MPHDFEGFGYMSSSLMFTVFFMPIQCEVWAPSLFIFQMVTPWWAAQGTCSLHLIHSIHHMPSKRALLHWCLDCTGLCGLWLKPSMLMSLEGCCAHFLAAKKNTSFSTATVEKKEGYQWSLAKHGEMGRLSVAEPPVSSQDTLSSMCWRGSSWQGAWYGMMCAMKWNMEHAKL